MPVYKDKSHEDLRWEDYQLGDKGGPLASPPPSTGMAGFNLAYSPIWLYLHPSLSKPFQTAQPAQSSGTFSFSNFGQTQPAGGSSFGGTPGMFCQNNFGLQAIPQNSMVAQPAPINTNPFGTLHALPQMSIGRVGNTPSVQYGISSMPVQDKPAPVRISSVLTARHLSQRRIKYPLRKYKNEGSRVPIFSNDDDTPTTPKADALLIPRENPRALIICPMDQWPGKASEKASSFKDRRTKVNENGTAAENGVVKEQVQPVPTKHASNRSNEDHSLQKADMYKTLGGHIAGEASIVYEHGADVEALMPKLQKSDYLTLPRIHKLAAMETAEPGFCSHVKDFVVGRQGYGSIRFLGVTDVRGLDLESIVQFDIHKLIVYPDDSKKPPVGQGLNKPAEVTLNIKYFDKKAGQQYTGGPRIDKYKEMLKRMAKNQGVEFVSYDANKGEWKFKVNHFSSYEHETTLSEPELVFDPNCSVVIKDDDDLISNGVIIMGIAPSDSSVLHASFFPFEDSRYKVEDLERLRDLGLRCPQIIMSFQNITKHNYFGVHIPKHNYLERHYNLWTPKA
ncbi:hypothetical protein P8452_40987 [Trifolium repens]|nr:hypothetical protein P8452_40987 [Trifolium repens]